MNARRNWTREELLVALYLYHQLPFGSFDQRNTEVQKFSKLIGRTPSALAMKLSNLASLDPVITSSGRKGLEGASKADRLIWAEMNTNWASFKSEISDAVANFLTKDQTTIETLPAGQKQSNSNLDYTGKERLIVTKARVGQSLFRNAVLSSYNFQCCVSGLSIPKLLVASHIVPWKDDEKNRLHPRNGLALSMIHDKAFDLGIMTVTDDFKVLISKKYHSKDDEFFKKSILCFDGESLILPNKFSPNPEFLEHHRDIIFESKAA